MVGAHAEAGAGGFEELYSGKAVGSALAALILFVGVTQQAALCLHLMQHSDNFAQCPDGACRGTIFNFDNDAAHA